MKGHLAGCDKILQRKGQQCRHKTHEVKIFLLGAQLEKKRNSKGAKSYSATALHSIAFLVAESCSAGAHEGLLHETQTAIVTTAAGLETNDLKLACFQMRETDLLFFHSL